MEPPMRSATAIWHNDTYSGISPERLELNANGKHVVITGAGSGIGRETAIAFASAGAGKLTLLGRRHAPLEETATLLPSDVSVGKYPVDICHAESVKRIAAATGSWDILILAAGHNSQPSLIASADPDDWWKCFETNVKGNFTLIQEFLPSRNPTKATILALTSSVAAVMPTKMLVGASAYNSSKVALEKMIDFVSTEYPEVMVASVHPGFVDTSIFEKSGADKNLLPMDTVQLAAHFLVWMASDEAEFLKGKVVWANWDINELKLQKEAICRGADVQWAR